MNPCGMRTLGSIQAKKTRNPISRESPPPETVARTVSELNYKWARYVLPYVKPIFEANEKGEPDPIASGVLVSLREKQYLLTAHHVIADPPAHELCVALYTFLPEQMQVTGPAVGALDPHDVALVQIPQSPRRCLRLPHHLTMYSVKRSWRATVRANIFVWVCS
jgi:S1-C subfamily serine protease